MHQTTLDVNYLFTYLFISTLFKAKIVFDLRFKNILNNIFSRPGEGAFELQPFNFNYTSQILIFIFSFRATTRRIAFFFFCKNFFVSIALQIVNSCKNPLLCEITIVERRVYDRDKAREGYKV